jgi:hypothetical protein
MAFVNRVADLLDERHIAFALIGAEAMAARGVPRSSYDVDLFTVDPQVLQEPFWEPIRALANVEIRSGDFDDPLRGVVRIRPANEKSIDVVVGRWKWQRRAIERAEPTPSDERSLPTVTATDLILFKLAAGGLQDLWDVDRLLAVIGEGIVSEVEERLSDLQPDARAHWQRIRQK